MSHQKNFICYESKIRECGLCHERKSFDKYSKEPSGKPKSYCMPCRSKMIATKQLEDKLKRYPSLYNQCDNDDCLHVWNKRRGNNCPKCGHERALI